MKKFFYLCFFLFYASSFAVENNYFIYSEAENGYRNSRSNTIVSQSLVPSGRRSALHTFEVMDTNVVPPSPFFAPFNSESGFVRNANTIDFPLIVWFSSIHHGSSLPNRILQQMANDQIRTEEIILSAVFQNSPFNAQQRLLFKPHVAVSRIMAQHRVHQTCFPVKMGLFPAADTDQISLNGRQTNVVEWENLWIRRHGANNTLTSQNAFELVGVNPDDQASFYTYLSLEIGQRKYLFVTLHIMLNAIQNETASGYMENLAQNGNGNTGSICDHNHLMNVLGWIRDDQSFQGNRGIIQAINLLNSNHYALPPTIANPNNQDVGAEQDVVFVKNSLISGALHQELDQALRGRSRKDINLYAKNIRCIINNTDASNRDSVFRALVHNGDRVVPGQVMYWLACMLQNYSAGADRVRIASTMLPILGNWWRSVNENELDDYFLNFYAIFSSTPASHRDAIIERFKSHMFSYGTIQTLRNELGQYVDGQSRINRIDESILPEEFRANGFLRNLRGMVSHEGSEALGNSCRNLPAEARNMVVDRLSSILLNMPIDRRNETAISLSQLNGMETKNILFLDQVIRFVGEQKKMAFLNQAVDSLNAWNGFPDRQNLDLSLSLLENIIANTPLPQKEEMTMLIGSAASFNHGNVSELYRILVVEPKGIDRIQIMRDYISFGGRIDEVNRVRSLQIDGRLLPYGSTSRTVIDGFLRGMGSFSNIGIADSITRSNDMIDSLEQRILDRNDRADKGNLRSIQIYLLKQIEILGGLNDNWTNVAPVILTKVIEVINADLFQIFFQENHDLMKDLIQKRIFRTMAGFYEMTHLQKTDYIVQLTTYILPSIKEIKSWVSELRENNYEQIVNVFYDLYCSTQMSATRPTREATTGLSNIQAFRLPIVNARGYLFEYFSQFMDFDPKSNTVRNPYNFSFLKMNVIRGINNPLRSIRVNITDDLHTLLHPEYCNDTRITVFNPIPFVECLKSFSSIFVKSCSDFMAANKTVELFDFLKEMPGYCLNARADNLTNFYHSNSHRLRPAGLQAQGGVIPRERTLLVRDVLQNLYGEDDSEIPGAKIGDANLHEKLRIYFRVDQVAAITGENGPITEDVIKQAIREYIASFGNDLNLSGINPTVHTWVLRRIR